MFRAFSFLLISLIGCGTSLPRPPVSSHSPEEFVEVPFPPPTVRSEEVSARPNSAALWIDGEWRWQDDRWTWRRGRWVVPPAGATLAPWEIHRTGTGMRYAASLFRLPGGDTLAPSELRQRRRRSRGSGDCSSPEPASFNQKAGWR